MSKTSQIEKAIASLEADRKVIDLAIARLRAEQTSKPARVKKQKPASAEPAGSSR